MAVLATLEEAKLHLHLETTTDHDADITAKLDAASAVIVDYLDVQADETWTPETVPLFIKGAVLLMLAHLWVHRGDDHAPNDEAVWDGVRRLLARWRTLAFA